MGLKNMFEIVSTLFKQLVDTMNTFIPIILVMNLVASLLWGRE